MRIAIWASVCVALFIVVAEYSEIRADAPPAAPTTQGTTRAYSFRGYSVAYPEGWRLREREAGPATIYMPDGPKGILAMWDLERKTDPDKRSAERVRDDVTQSLAATMKGYKFRSKGQMIVSGKEAAYVTYEHSVVSPQMVERQVFIPTADGFVLIACETSPAQHWDAFATQLDSITRSLRLP